MFKKILIANRGEVALRIIRAANEMGIKTVIVYSQADKDEHYLNLADEAVCIGGPLPKDSYLNIPAIISAAEITDVEAIHPGYGFLAENAHFAEVCESCEIKFIGPTASTIRQMGDKMAARDAMQKVGVPITPGTTDSIQNKEEALRVAKQLKYPIILKASAGGGGKGMRVCHNDMRLMSAMLTAEREAEAAFGNGTVYIEKYFEKCRHVEIQVVGDNYGNIIHLNERDCTIQRRHQKLIEECPSPAVDAKLRRKMGEVAVKAAQAANYVSAGTVEFLLNDDGKFYFLEMNTRIQVEHGVTELVSGMDLVKEQIAIAAGEKLSIRKQDKVPLNGSAIECRINAEDYKNNFAPSPGLIDEYYAPGGLGVRIDTHVGAGSLISPFYDSMVSKLMAHGPNREQAIQTLTRALDEYKIGPIKTTIPLHREIVRNPVFKRGMYYTDFIQRLFGKYLKDSN
ncbi:MAG: acetyl-CoA carboxylase biotin carboxylase subunit [Candidatus Omnitrophota bacterium]|jgi:acetyl-CoA carboxylase biotin carboxylase subunit